MSAVDGLILRRRIPPRVHEVDVRGHGEVERHAARLERDEDHLDGVVLLEGGEHGVARGDGHAAGELDRLQSAVLQAVLHQVEEGDELRENDGLGGRVALEHAVQLLHERLHLGRRLEGLEVEPREDPLVQRTPTLAPAPAAFQRRTRPHRQVHRQGLRACRADHRDALRRRAHVVLHAALAEEVAARRPHRIIRVLVAKSAHNALPFAIHPARGGRGLGGSGERVAGLGALRVQHEVGMVRRLPQPSEEIKDVRVVVEQRACLHIGAELGHRLRVDGLVEVVLALVEEVGLYGHHLGRQHHLVRSGSLGAAQQHLVEHVTLEGEEAVAAGAHVPKLADWVDHIAVEERVVLQRAVPTIVALAVLVVEAMLAALALAAGHLAEVVGVRVDSQELYEGVELPNAVLQWGARETPAIICSQLENCLRCRATAVLDSMSLIEHNTMPV
mmetsp:Transcript_30689/g.65963  ORF Transcript_30689/g.65963 Transcript_30689/m.65963 type:complete len:445 (+) Transcript_30689:464-1798(+)